MVKMYASVCLDDDVEMVKERRNVNNKAEENKKKRLIFLSRLGDLNIASAPLLCVRLGLHQGGKGGFPNF